jgi:hypothetical protein
MSISITLVALWVYGLDYGHEDGNFLEVYSLLESRIFGIGIAMVIGPK